MVTVSNYCGQIFSEIFETKTSSTKVNSSIFGDPFKPSRKEHEILESFLRKDKELIKNATLQGYKPNLTKECQIKN